jgi:hypothetical protein
MSTSVEKLKLTENCQFFVCRKYTKIVDIVRLSEPLHLSHNLDDFHCPRLVILLPVTVIGVCPSVRRNVSNCGWKKER